MQALERIFTNVVGQLRDLSAASRLLVGSVAIILVMGLFIVALYAGRTDMVPLPVQLTGESRGEVESYLQARGIRYEDRGGALVVPVEQRHIVLAELTDKAIIDPDAIDFEALVRQDSPFLSRAQHDRRWLVATMNHLSRTVSRMKGVERADVVIDEPARAGGLGRAHMKPSASVTVVMRTGALDQVQVNAIAGMVAGAHAELRPEDVVVIDANHARAHHARDEGGLHGGRYLELQQETVKVYEATLERALGYIPGVNIAVNVIVDHRDVVEQSRRVDEPKQGLTRESSRTVASTNQTAGGEPGVRSNTGASIAGAARRTSSLSDESAETAMVPAFGGTDSRTHDPGGYALKINASIGVPRSYFQRLAEGGGDADAGAADDGAFDELVQAEVERIRRHVEPLIDTGPNGGPAEGTVAVRMIPDFAVAASSAAGGAQGAVLTESLVRYGGLGGLAALSLLMMFMMVRRAAGRSELPDAEELTGAPPPPLELVGDADLSEPPLDAIEIDEDDVRHRQMLAQINDLAADRPEEAASVLRRWIREISA